METPSSISRSFPSSSSSSSASVASQKKMQEDAKPERSALLDITNDSPIVGLATGSLKTPSSSAIKSRVRPTKTPGSGEALLRGQVKNLLQKVEEETEFARPPPPPPVEAPPHVAAPFRALLRHLLSPRTLLAPTPNNTPQIPQAPEEVLEIPPKDEKEQMGECQLNRALLFDSPDKSDVSGSSTVCSVLTYEGSSTGGIAEKDDDGDGSSAWSTKANVGSHNEEEEEGDGCYDEEQEEEEEEGYGDLMDELCQGLSQMSVVERRAMPAFEGRHTRFVYNSDNEIEGEEEVKGVASPNVLVLKGLPVPEGKHLRFQEEEDEEH